MEFLKCNFVNWLTSVTFCLNFPFIFYSQHPIPEKKKEGREMRDESEKWSWKTSQRTLKFYPQFFLVLPCRTAKKHSVFVVQSTITAEKFSVRILSNHGAQEIFFTSNSQLKLSERNERGRVVIRPSSL